MQNKTQSFIGSIIGGAVGDSFGSPFEGKAGPVSLQPWRPGSLTDDTQLTLATCEAIGADGSILAEDVATRFLTWYRQGRLTGLGASTLKALVDLNAGAHWALAGRRGDRAAGNGAAMRVAPLAFLLDPEDPQQRRTLGDICRITHHNDEAYTGALAIVLAIRMVTEGDWEPGRPLLEPIAQSLPDTNVRDGLLTLVDLQTKAPLWEIGRHFGCSGYVAESVPMAILAAERCAGSGLEATIRDSVEIGGDTDTIASMVGQIVGAWIGFDSIPQSLYQDVPEIDSVIQSVTGAAKLLPKS